MIHVWHIPRVSAESGFKGVGSRRGVLFASAFAQATAPESPSGVDMIMQLVPFALIASMYYFFVWRRKPTKQHVDLGYFNVDSSAVVCPRKIRLCSK
jgi:hypothetical protein